MSKSFCDTCHTVKEWGDGTHRCMICARQFVPIDNAQTRQAALAEVETFRFRQDIQETLYRNAERSYLQIMKKLKEGGYGPESG